MSARIVLATLNAKYIHASLGLRYLMANMARHGGADVAALTTLHEFTIRRPAQQIVDALLLALGNAPLRIVGLGVYIWNVTETTVVVRLLKAQCPQVKVVLGGPQVSHEWQGAMDGADQGGGQGQGQGQGTHEGAVGLVAMADHLITGWGDVSFPKLCRALVHGPQPLMKVITGEQPPLDALDLPYGQYSDSDLAQRVLYVEASRGCPFKCAFCLSALDKTAWAFALEPFLAALATLYARGARNFKFVDRTFNLKVETSLRILQFFLDRLHAAPHEPLHLHFELVPDHLPDALKVLVAQFPAGVLQFEIGIQSFNTEVQHRIARRQDNRKTEDNLRWLLAHSTAHLHTDLIFGLPGETWDSFAEGFDRLHALGPHEIQLGLLKRLPGTPLAQRSRPGAVAEDGTVYDPEPPFAVLQTGAVSAVQVQAFVRLARFWDLLVNSGRFGQGSRLLLQGASAFAAWAAFAQWLWQRTGSTHRLTPELLLDAVFEYLTAERALNADAVRAALLADYLASGARSNPTALAGLLPRREKARVPKQGRGQRQTRHQKVGLRPDVSGAVPVQPTALPPLKTLTKA